MKPIRLPFFVLAVVVLLAVVLVERSTLRPAEVAARLPPFLLGRAPLPLNQASSIFSRQQQTELNRLLSEVRPVEIDRLRRGGLAGYGVRSLQYVDGLLLFSVVLVALSLFLPRLFSRYEFFHAKLQGIVTLIFDIIVILAAIVLVFQVIVKLIVMIVLLLSFPFGTLAYLIIYGHFPRGAMIAVLNLIFLLKLLFGALILLAHQDFIKNLGLVISTLGALAANLVVTILLGIVPGILVSITDAIAAIIVIIIGIILAIVMAVFSVISIVAALKPV